MRIQRKTENASVFTLNYCIQLYLLLEDAIQNKIRRLGEKKHKLII